jgi:hypothetical protein
MRYAQDPRIHLRSAEYRCDAEIDALRRADAHGELARRLAGDRQVDNQLQHSEKLIQCK